MSQFDKREKGFEQKHSRDQEFNFKVQARRNKLLGEWAAEKLGLDGTAAVAYAKEVIVSGFDEPGDDDVLRKVFRDWKQKGQRPASISSVKKWTNCWKSRGAKSRINPKFPLTVFGIRDNDGNIRDRVCARSFVGDGPYRPD